MSALAAVRTLHRPRRTVDALADLQAACESLGVLADRGICRHDVPALERTIEGMSTLLVDLRAGGEV